MLLAASKCWDYWLHARYFLYSTMAREMSPPTNCPFCWGGDLGHILYMAPWAYQSPYPRQYQDQLIHFSTVCSCDHQKPHYIGNSRLHHLLCMRACVLLCMRYTHARTHTFNGPLSRTTRLSRFYWSKRQWVAVASARPYASLHLAPDRWPCQHPTT